MPKTRTYEIHVGEVLDDKWSAYFAPFIVSRGEGETILTGEAQDQAELYGVLYKIRDSGLVLISVLPVKQ